jgi:ectoine hydroxylase-related dioxygenase (phytanoyl-CoA dioxygenase family)
MRRPADLDAPYALDRERIDFFRQRGYVKLKAVFGPQTLEHYGRAISAAVVARNRQHKPMSERTTYEKAFLQITNLWRTHERAREFVFGKRLARLAAQLMGVAHVRLYHDQALYKEPGGGITPWHADQYYWPLANANTCTAWVPLQRTELAMGPLGFAAGSHRFEFGRDLVISDESERALQSALSAQNFEQDVGPFDLGEVSFHYGWTFHRAGPNRTERPRAVMTIIYMEDGMRLIEPQRKEHIADWQAFMPAVKPGEVIAGEHNPLLA